MSEPMPRTLRRWMERCIFGENAGRYADDQKARPIGRLWKLGLTGLLFVPALVNAQPANLAYEPEVCPPHPNAASYNAARVANERNHHLAQLRGAAYRQLDQMRWEKWQAVAKTAKQRHQENQKNSIATRTEITERWKTDRDAEFATLSEGHREARDDLKESCQSVYSSGDQSKIERCSASWSELGRKQSEEYANLTEAYKARRNAELEGNTNRTRDQNQKIEKQKWDTFEQIENKYKNLANQIRGAELADFGCPPEWPQLSGASVIGGNTGRFGIPETDAPPRSGV